jgi:drug/metabolite transporter (DMT)-like permease
VSRTGGILLVLGGAVGFATLPLFAKWGHAAGLDATSMNAVRLAATAAILFAWVALSSRETARVAPRDLAWLVLFGALDCALSGVLYFTALATLDASLAHMLIFTFPAMVAVLARLVYGEPLTAARVGAVLLSFAGSALVVGRASLPAVTAAFLGAVGLVLAAALILALYHVVVQGVLARHRPIPVVAWMAASGAVALALYDAPRLGAYPALVAANWPVLAGLVAVPTVGATVLYVSGVARLGAARAALVATIEPFVTVVLAGLLFGERFTPGQWLGGGLIVAAIVLAQRPAPQGDLLPAAAAAPARAAGD